MLRIGSGRVQSLRHGVSEVRHLEVLEMVVAVAVQAAAERCGLLPHALLRVATQLRTSFAS